MPFTNGGHGGPPAVIYAFAVEIAKANPSP